MNTETVTYQGHSLRYTTVSGNGILLNTTDICRILDITERPAGSHLSRSSMDIVSVIQAALSEGKSNMDFVEWLQGEFVGYKLQTPIRPNWNDDWKLE